MKFVLMFIPVFLALTTLFLLKSPRFANWWVSNALKHANQKIANWSSMLALIMVPLMLLTGMDPHILALCCLISCSSLMQVERFLFKGRFQNDS